MHGMPLDGESLETIPFNMVEDLETILCYDYEDGKPWHDLTCVMELIFNNLHYELVGDSRRIRYVYDHPFYLIRDFSELTKNGNCGMVAIRMDLTAGWYQHENKDRDIRFEDFEVFNCTIKHKQRFHPKNPDMPYD
jgi:hypothetical protein